MSTEPEVGSRVCEGNGIWSDPVGVTEGDSCELGSEDAMGFH